MKPKRRFALTGIEDRLDRMLPHTAEQTPQYKGRGADKPAPRPLYGFTRSFRPLLQANLISAVLVPIGHGIHAALDKSQGILLYAGLFQQGICLRAGV